MQLEIDGDFLYFLADAAVTAVGLVSFSVTFIRILWSVIVLCVILQFQYGNPDKLCIPLVEAKKSGENLVV